MFDNIHWPGRFSPPPKWKICSVFLKKIVQYAVLLNDKREFQSFIEKCEKQAQSNNGSCYIIYKQANSLNKYNKIEIFFFTSNDVNETLHLRVFIPKRYKSKKCNAFLVYLNSKNIISKLKNTGLYVKCKADDKWQSYYSLFGFLLRRSVQSVIGAQFYVPFISTHLITNELNFLHSCSCVPKTQSNKKICSSSCDTPRLKIHSLKISVKQFHTSKNSSQKCLKLDSETKSCLPSMFKHANSALKKSSINRYKMSNQRLSLYRCKEKRNWKIDKRISKLGITNYTNILERRRLLNFEIMQSFQEPEFSGVGMNPSQNIWNDSALSSLGKSTEYIVDTNNVSLVNKQTFFNTNIKDTSIGCGFQAIESEKMGNYVKKSLKTVSAREKAGPQVALKIRKPVDSMNDLFVKNNSHMGISQVCDETKIKPKVRMATKTTELQSASTSTFNLNSPKPGPLDDSISHLRGLVSENTQSSTSRRLSTPGFGKGMQSTEFSPSVTTGNKRSLQADLKIDSECMTTPSMALQTVSGKFLTVSKKAVLAAPKKFNKVGQKINNDIPYQDGINSTLKVATMNQQNSKNEDFKNLNTIPSPVTNRLSPCENKLDRKLVQSTKFAASDYNKMDIQPVLKIEPECRSAPPMKFQTVSGKFLKLSEKAILAAQKMFDDVCSQEIDISNQDDINSSSKMTDNNKQNSKNEDCKNLNIISPATNRLSACENKLNKKSVQSTEFSTSATNYSKMNIQPGFEKTVQTKVFQTASGKSLKVSEKAISSAQKMYSEVCSQEIDILDQEGLNSSMKLLPDNKQNSKNEENLDILDSALLENIFGDFDFDDKEPEKKVSKPEISASNISLKMPVIRNTRKSLGGRVRLKPFTP